MSEDQRIEVSLVRAVEAKAAGDDPASVAEGPPSVVSKLVSAARSPVDLLAFMPAVLIYRAVRDALATHKEQGQLRKEDAEVLGELIERGKKSGAAEMEITLTKEQHAGLRGKLAEPKSGISAELLAGGQGEGQYKLRVRYK
jgi:hypothetical protein